MPVKTAIVTGASKGLGRAAADRLLADGWRVHNLDRLPPASPDTASVWTEVDLGDEAATAAVLERIVSTEPVTGLVNNVGIPNADLLEDLSLASFDRVIALHARTAVQATQAVARGMKAEGFGRIVNISSRAQLGKTQRTAYGAAKAALVTMAKVWALELGAHGITCNVVAPGPVRTELFERQHPPGDPKRAAILADVPAGRFGEPEDIANAISFFMDKRAGFVTGQVLYVCGGVSLTRAGN